MNSNGKSNEAQGAQDAKCQLPYPLHLDAILVAVDMEGHCHRSEASGEVLTEVGLTWLDTRKIRNVKPGDRGHLWFSSMEYKHWRISDLEHLHVASKCKKSFHKGDSAKFRFAKSEWVKISELPTKFNRLMNNMSTAQDGSSRMIVPVTFESRMEVRLCNRYQLNLFDRPNSLGNIDIRFLNPSEVWKDEGTRNNNKPSLANLSLALGLADAAWMAEYAHNGGNDAVLTLQGLIAGLLLTSEQLSAVGYYKENSRLPDCLPLLRRSWPQVKIPQYDLPRDVTRKEYTGYIYGRRNIGVENIEGETNEAWVAAGDWGNEVSNSGVSDQTLLLSSTNSISQPPAGLNAQLSTDSNSQAPEVLSAQPVVDSSVQPAATPTEKPSYGLPAPPPPGSKRQPNFSKSMPVRGKQALSAKGQSQPPPMNSEEDFPSLGSKGPRK